jgi:hypothetical protein
MADDLANKLGAIERDGEARFGKSAWDAGVAAIRKAAAPNGGLSENDIRQVAADKDPAGLLMTLGRHALLAQASEGDREAENAYRKIRNEERKAHAHSRGRIWEWD